MFSHGFQGFLMFFLSKNRQMVTAIRSLAALAAQAVQVAELELVELVELVLDPAGNFRPCRAMRLTEQE